MSDQPQDRDPVVHSSLSKQLLIWSALLVIVTGWGLYDELYGIRPWKDYQARFRKRYAKYLTTARLGEVEIERQIKASPEYRQLDGQVQAAERAIAPQIAEIGRQVNQDLTPK